MRGYATGTALFLCFLGLALVHEAWSLGLLSRGVIQPGFFPFLVGASLAILGVIEAFSACKDADVSARFWGAHAERWSVVFLVAALVGFTLMLEPLGFSLSTLLFLFAVMTVWGRYGWMRSLAVAALSAAAIQVVFIAWLNVPLPRGSLF